MEEISKMLSEEKFIHKHKSKKKKDPELGVKKRNSHRAWIKMKLLLVLIFLEKSICSQKQPRVLESEPLPTINPVLQPIIDPGPISPTTTESFCTSESKSQKKFFSSATTGSENDQIEVNCPATSTSIRVHAWVRFNLLPDASSKKQMIMSISGKFKVYLEYNAGDNKSYVRVDVGAEINVMEREVWDMMKWHLIWVEFSGTNARLTVVFYDVPPIENLIQAVTGSEFTLQSTAPIILKLVKVVDIETEEGFTGSIGAYGYGCKPLGPTLTNGNGWALISHSHNSSAIASYILDHEAQIYGNILDAETKEPALINGGTTAIDANSDALRESTRTVFGENKFMKINAIDMKYNDTDLIYGISVVFSVQFTAFPSAGTSSTILEIEGEKSIKLLFSDTEVIEIDLGNGNSIKASSEIPLNTQIGIKFYIGRIPTQGVGVYSFELAQDGSGIQAANGNYIAWDTLPASTTHKVGDFWSLTFGSSSNQATDPYRMIIDMIVVYKGNVAIREMGDNYSCRTQQTDPYCKMQIIHTRGQVCLHCLVDQNVMWYSDLQTKDLICEIPSSGADIPAGVSVMISEINYINLSLFQICKYGKYLQGGNCFSCDPSCGGSCGSSAVGDCQGCDWSSNNYLSGPSPNSCATCSGSQNSGFGQCGTCSTNGGCSSCKYGKCESCSGSGEISILGVCCDLTTHYISESEGNFFCNLCNAACGSCDGAGRENCITCANAAGVEVDGLCPIVTPCSSNEWDNGGTCETCPTGCSACSSGTVCTSCVEGYAFSSNLCVECTSAGSFINSAVSPPICDSCPNGCATCTSKTNCGTCESGFGLLNNLCKICSNNGNYYLSSGTCTRCPTDCSACSGDTSCTTCGSGKYLLESGICGDCDTSNGFRIDSSSSQDKCFACTISDCLSCTETDCTLCSAGKGYDPIFKTCVACSSTKYLTTGNSPNTCNDCPNGCISCSSLTVCSSCEASYYLDGVCNFCDTTNGYYIETSTAPETCSQCGENCSICSSASTCNTCKENHFPVGDGSCVLCDVENGKFIKDGTTCESCGEKCKTCDSGTTCTVCDNENFENLQLVGGKCIQCNLLNNKFVDLSGVCKECDISCNGCLLQTGNCLECQEGYIKLTEEESNLVGDSNCLTKERYEELTANETEEGCDESCLSCSEANNPLKCATCQEGLCLKTTGECSTCPPKTPVVTDPNDFFQTSTFTFVVKQRIVNNFKEYKIVFSEEEVFFDASIDTKKIKDYLKIELSQSKTPQDYTFEANFSPELNTITITLSFSSSIPKSDLTVEILNPEKIKSMSGKTLSNKESKIDFPGFSLLSKTAKETLEIFATSSQGTSTGAIATSSGTVAVSSLFSNAMASLTKLIQIIEFSALMELYNVDYDQNMGIFLRSVNEATEFEILVSPTEKTVDRIRNSIAGVWKGKLSKVKTKPLLLQDLGYPGILMIGIYLVQTYFMMTLKNPGKTFIMFRISIFNALLIDYNSICLRTLGYYPISLNESSNSADHISYALACFIMSFFTYEFCFMYNYSNNPKLYSSKQKLTNLEKSLKEIFYNGIKPEILKENWFGRNYNFLYLSRFSVVCVLIFNLQNLQILQVIMSLIILVGFSALTFYHQIKHGIFISKFVSVYRLIQEASMTLIIILINIFMFDSFYNFLSQKMKIGLVFSFICLLALNILLEVTGALVSVLDFVRMKCTEKKEVKKTKRVAPTAQEIRRNHRILNEKNIPKIKEKNNFKLSKKKNWNFKRKKMSIRFEKRGSKKMVRSPFVKSKLPGGKIKKKKLGRLFDDRSSIISGSTDRLRIRSQVQKSKFHQKKKNKKRKFFEKEDRSNVNLKMRYGGRALEFEPRPCFH